MKENLVRLLEQLLGPAKILKHNELLFYCPFCSVRHHKPKLAVNVKNQGFHCWICLEKGKSLYQLFRKLKATSAQFEELYRLTGHRYSTPEVSENVKTVSLPPEFIPLWLPNKMPEYKHAVLYLESRNISIDDIMKYNIGYADIGQYKNMIIVPSYDKDGNLNYFVGRSFYKDSHIKYKTPPISKDVIGFEFLVSFLQPLVLVEGVFDAVSVRRNAIPLFGKTISSKLRDRILKSGVTDIYFALDRDAMTEMVNAAEELMGLNKRIYIMDLPTKDPSDLGFEKFMALMNRTEPLTFSKLMRYKLCI